MSLQEVEEIKKIEKLKRRLDRHQAKENQRFNKRLKEWYFLVYFVNHIFFTKTVSQHNSDVNMMNTDSIIFNKVEGWFRLLIYQEFHKIENETLKDARKCSTRFPETWFILKYCFLDMQIISHLRLIMFLILCACWWQCWKLIQEKVLSRLERESSMMETPGMTGQCWSCCWWAWEVESRESWSGSCCLSSLMEDWGCRHENYVEYLLQSYLVLEAWRMLEQGWCRY